MDGKTAAEIEVVDSVVFQSLQDEIVILNMENQEYYGLDNVGADAWQLLLEHGNLSDVARRMQELYDVDEETARRDLGVLVDELLGAGLLRKLEASV
jgi:hypothetical protein